MQDSDLFLDESPAIQARARAKFQPKFKPKPKPKDGTSSSITSKPLEIIKDDTAATVPSAEPDNVVDESKSSQVTVPDSPLAEFALSNYSIDTNSSFEKSVEKMSMLLNHNADLGFGFECLDPLLTQSSNNDGDVRIDNEETEIQFQETGNFPDVDAQDIMSDMTIASGKRSGKFKPKSRLRTSVVTSPPAVVESVMHPTNVESVPSETMFEEGLIPDFPTDHVPDCALVDLGSFIPTDPSTSECPVNEKPANLAVASGGMSSNIVEMDASLVSNHSQKSKQSSTGDKVNEKGEARKQLIEQTNNPLIVDDLEDGTCNNDGLAVELLRSYAIDEDKDDNDGECNVEHASPKRITSKRSKKPVNEIEKPPRKRKTANDAKKQKKANETSDNPEKEQRKKFSHSTRRKRKFVDESLLNMPEEEIDFAKVALKDLILYADHKERLAKKEAQALKVPLTDQSTQHTFDEENARDDERSIASEQDQGFMDDQFDYELPVKKGNGSLNYQTYMKKEPRARWSKLDTELFYGMSSKVRKDHDDNDERHTKHINPNEKRRQNKPDSLKKNFFFGYAQKAVMINEDRASRLQESSSDDEFGVPRPQLERRITVPREVPGAVSDTDPQANSPDPVPSVSTGSRRCGDARAISPSGSATGMRRVYFVGESLLGENGLSGFFRPQIRNHLYGFYPRWCDVPIDIKSAI